MLLDSKTDSSGFLVFFSVVFVFSRWFSVLVSSRRFLGFLWEVLFFVVVFSSGFLFNIFSLLGSDDGNISQSVLSLGRLNFVWFYIVVLASGFSEQWFESTVTFLGFRSWALIL